MSFTAEVGAGLPIRLSPGTPAADHVPSRFFGSGSVGQWLGGVFATGTSSVHELVDGGLLGGGAGDVPGVDGFLPP